MAVNLIDNEEIHVNQDGSDITLEIQADALKNDNVVVGSIRSKNMLSPSNIISGIYTVGDGTYSSTSSGCCTARKIEIDNTKDYILTTGNTSGAFNIYVMFYDNSNNYLGYINVASNISLKLSTFSNYSNSKYINLRFDVAISSLNKPQFEEGTTATPYSPYQELNGLSSPIELLNYTSITQGTDYTLSDNIMNYKYLIVQLSTAANDANSNKQYIPVSLINAFDNNYRTAISLFQSTTVYIFGDFYFSANNKIRCNTYTRASWNAYLKVWGIK